MSGSTDEEAHLRWWVGGTAKWGNFDVLVEGCDVRVS